MAEAARINFSPLAKAMKDMDPLTLADMERDQRGSCARSASAKKKPQRLPGEHGAPGRGATPPRAARRRGKEGSRGPESSRSEGQRHLRLPTLRPQNACPFRPCPRASNCRGSNSRKPPSRWPTLRHYRLRERAALWWVSNQSDDLLCLPHCRLERLEYQLRTALRVLGPLRGRALLSDEVGLGKTIEAGLVLKELLTRGMVKRFLVLTVPSLVDQWEEELSDKFGLTTVTTNHAEARGDAQQFWRENPGLVASLHTAQTAGAS